MKEFDFTEDEGDVREDIPFRIHYKGKKTEMVDDGEGGKNRKTSWTKQSVDFTARGEVPGGLMMQTVGGFSQGASVASERVLGFLRKAVIDEDTERFDAFINDPNVRVHMKDLAKIVEWLIEQYNEDPTGA